MPFLSLLNCVLKLTHDSIFCFLDFYSTEALVQNIRKAREPLMHFRPFKKSIMPIGLNINLFVLMVEVECIETHSD